MQQVDVVVIGAGAAGLMCAIEAAKRSRKVLVLDHANKVGKKILMSGGGRCNFTNYQVEAENYISNNPHFCKSALKRYNQWDFIALVQAYNIAFHERKHGQLFCDNSAKDIVNMLLSETEKYQVKIQLNSEIDEIKQCNDVGFQIRLKQSVVKTDSLVIATGGLSIPKVGASAFGYQLAEQLGIRVIPTRAGLVPLTLHQQDKQKYSTLTGIAVASDVESKRISFNENLLFSHRGLSGPAILQISSYWLPGEEININLIPEIDLLAEINREKKQAPNMVLRTLLNRLLPKRLLSTFLDEKLLSLSIKQVTEAQLVEISRCLSSWNIKPNATEGYRTAEVTLGGVDCNELSSQTFECRNFKGLYFIGEVLDVTGWLGGYNFQWAWSSGWCAGQYV